jgi:hypothetical protein
METLSLSRKNVTVDYTGFKTMKLWIGVMCMLLIAGVCVAQEPISEPLGGEEPIPVPIRTGEPTETLGTQTFADDVFQSLRNHFGFTMGAYEAYTTDISTGGRQQRQGSGITAFIPRAFVNFGKRKSKLHIDVGSGYRIYNRYRQLDGWDYYGAAQYSYRVSKRASFQLSDQLTSSYNDSGSFISLYSPPHYDYDFSNEMLVNRQRITRNSLTAAFDYEPNRRTQLSLFGGYNLYRYPQNDVVNVDGFELGGSLNFKITNWLYLTNEYSAYLNRVDKRFRDSRIHRLQLGGLDFHVGHSWRIWIGGGANIANEDEGFHNGESISSGISYTSRRSAFSVTYQRGFTYAIGISTLLHSDMASARYGYRIKRWMSANLQSSYYRGSELSGSGVIDTLTGGGGLEFAIRQDLIASVNSYYQNQRTHDFSIQGLGLHRFGGYVGLQYVWPSRRRQ